MSYAIIANNLSIKFADNQVLNDISFKVQTGNIFGLLGPSGAGKTTLIKLLTGQLKQDRGFAELLGKDTRKLTALEHKQIGAMMDNYGLYEDRGTAVSKLSKGMKNRLSLARALMNDVKILFLDKPTSGLDPAVNKTVLIQFVMFPIMTLIMNNAIKMQEMPENFFVNLFAAMYIGMAPLTSIASIISEEKEKNTLRVLIMSNVKLYEYLLGIGSYVWSACMLGGIVICAAGGYNLQTGMATSITVPAMMVLSFIGVIVINILIAAVMFIITFKKCNLS